jgi:predicted nucleic acid-binding protein
MKLYVDTNIFLDYLFERKNIFGKDLSRPAQKLFWRAIQCEFFIVYSSHTATELANQIDLRKTTFLFEALKKKIVPITITSEDIIEAKRLGKENYSDALHVILAKKSGADYIITRNLIHFKEFSRILNPKLPEDI